MTEAVKKALAELRTGEYKKERINNETYDMTEKFVDTPNELRSIAALEDMLAHETPNILKNDIFGFNRRNINTPYYCNSAGRKIRGGGGNLTPNYIHTIESGFEGILKEIAENPNSGDSQKVVFYNAMKRFIAAVLEISEQYRVAAEASGNARLAKALAWVPRKPARSFYEACLFFKIIIYVLRCANMVHLTLGRFDQYMYEYYKKDIARGVSREELLETLELFFISLNVDGDLYIGIQQGDNGQSMVLGGYDKDGNDMYNELSELCMEASLELSLIDPKINLRVNKTTSDSRYEYATKLTKKGLGFPQYCNDDIVVPFLIAHGYEEKDALDYTVAACWEHIVPNCAADTPNKGTMDFPGAVNRAVHEKLTSCADFNELMRHATAAIAEDCDAICERFRPKGAPGTGNSHYSPLSLFVDGCLEKGLDLSQGGAKYYNYGCHGAGIANAADALAAIKQVVFDEKAVTPEELLAALDADFVGYEELQNRLLACPKMGNNDGTVDDIACTLMDAFVNNLSGKPNGVYGGIWRAGTGSAMEYILTARKCPATADGRNAGKPYGCSFSPAITTRLNGPLSVIQSFTKFDMKKIANGGPLTMEVHDTVFRNAEGEKKVAQLVKAFIHLGGHQLQLNSINRDRLLDAQEHPEDHKNLIVRVWGWSGYFCELDREYQDHVIKRTEFMV
ncbi:MAG: pyruvate formate-lyase [Clostridia bacterium]|nr:pyruvate formate-lyase [Clostridia bacterium]